MEDIQVGNQVGGAIQANMRDVPTGAYNYNLLTGVVLRSAGGATGSTSETEGELIVVNSADSAFGSGWDLAGWQQIVEVVRGLKIRLAGSVMLVDGDGTELLFISNPVPGQTTYLSPPGDFSRLENSMTERSGVHSKTRRFINSMNTTNWRQ